MSPSLSNLLALVCATCGAPLEVPEGAEVFPCRGCRRAYEVLDDHLVERPVFTAAVTSARDRPEDARYLATWRFPARPTVRERRSGRYVNVDMWAAVERQAAPGPALLYVPAFTLVRMAVQLLGVALVEAQPRLSLAPGVPDDGPGRHQPAPEGMPGPAFGTVSPVLLSERDAQAVAHFVYLALESERTPDLQSIDYDLELGRGELLFVPGQYDPRWVRHANWRIMLGELDRGTA